MESNGLLFVPAPTKYPLLRAETMMFHIATPVA